jgi:hypothetical protein
MENDYAIGLSSNTDYATGARYNGSGNGKVKSSWVGALSENFSGSS